MLFRPPSPSKSILESLLVTGKSVAHSKLSVAERALLAADIRIGLKEYKPTLAQLAREFRISVPSLRAGCEIAHDPNARLDVVTGCYGLQTAAARHRNGNGNGKARNGKAKAMTPAAWAKADLATRRQHISSLGLASVWDVIETLTR